LNTLWAQTPWGTDIKYTNEGRDGNDYQFTAYQVVYSPNKGQFGTWENLNYFGTNGLNVTSKWIPAKAAMMPAAASATTITSPTSWGVTSLWEEAGALGRSIWSTLAGAGATATVIIGSLSIPSSERVTDRPIDISKPVAISPPKTQQQPLYEQYALIANYSGLYPVATWGVPFKPVTAPMVYLDKGDVWKYGITKNGEARYTISFYNNTGMGLQYVPQFSGTQIQARVEESTKIINYYFWHGDLPPGNKCFH